MTEVRPDPLTKCGGIFLFSCKKANRLSQSAEVHGASDIQNRARASGVHPSLPLVSVEELCGSLSTYSADDLVITVARSSRYKIPSQYPATHQGPLQLTGHWARNSLLRQPRELPDLLRHVSIEQTEDRSLQCLLLADQASGVGRP